MKTCSICSDYVEKSEMSMYRSTDIFNEPTCNVCVQSSLGEDYIGISTLSYDNYGRKNMDLRGFSDIEKRAYYKLYNKLYVINNPEKYSRRIKNQTLVYSPYRREIQRIYSMCKNLNSNNKVIHEVDHIVPVKGRNVCGLHLPCNLRIVTKDFNRAKSNKFTEPYYLHDNFGGKTLDFNFEHLDSETHKELLKFIKAYNEEYTNKFKHIMISLMDKMVHDSLCVEDFEEICSGMGIDIVSEYNKLLEMVGEDDIDDYFENQ